MEKTVYQIQIALKGFKPKIWRRVLILSDILLPDFHYVIQAVMGWTNSHLHLFDHYGIYYSEPQDEMWDDMDTVDYTDIRVSDLLQRENDTLIYEYDFGDDWEHQIVLEKILPETGETQLPLCLNLFSAYVILTSFLVPEDPPLRGIFNILAGTRVLMSPRSNGELVEELKVILKWHKI